MKTKVYSTDGAEVREMELEDSVFQAKISDGAVYYAVINELANRRVGSASTKTRGETNGSTAKPWPQKGTGRARSGDRKSPVWVGGGTAFGPKPRDYSYRIPKKMKRAAYRSILTMKANDAEMKVVEDFTVESGKTKDLATILANLGDEIRTVVVLGQDDTSVRRAGRNIPWLRVQSYNRLSAHDLFYGRRLIMLESAATNLGEMYGRTD